MPAFAGMTAYEKGSEMPTDIDPQSGFRLPLPRPEDLDAEARQLYDRMNDPKGGTIVGLNGPGGIRLHSSKAAVVGVPSAAHGQELVAVVVKNGEAAHNDIAQHCRARLSPEKWPDRIFYAAALPKTSGGKPDRVQVRTMVQEEIARRQKAGQR